ncbi:DUF2795 domain-containing protein [Streptomyces sp. T-3]|nr:DUF2795 domain-containing protein [Streptomyces sp. T-3]
MQRGSDRLNVHRDDEMKHQLQGLLRSGHSTRTEEWHDPEPAAEDDPEVSSGPVTPARAPSPVEAVRYELARLLGRGSFPASRSALLGTLRARHAPDQLIDLVADLPDGKVSYRNVHELAAAIVAGPDDA